MWLIRKTGSNMAQVVVDTNILSKLFSGDSTIRKTLDRYDEILVPFIVIGELYSGFRVGTKFADNHAVLQDFIQNPNVHILQSNDETPGIYGELFAFLRKQSTPIPINDVWIAAITVQSGLPLFTLDSDFNNLPQIRRA